MLKTLVKKQLMEIFRSYFYNAKTNKKRSKDAVVGYIVLFTFLMIVIIGGMFTVMSLALCVPLAQVGMSWLYFAIMSLMAVFLGTFGSVFNTYAGLYAAKDNDLLLSLPIPVRTLMASRLLGVYLMGLMYAAVVIVPAVIVYWMRVSAAPMVLLGGVLLTVLISLFVLTLSCALGWLVAKVSRKLKRKNFITVIVSLAGIAVYYFFVFKAQTALEALVANAALYGEKVKGAAYPPYLVGCVGTGDGRAMLLVSLIVAALFALMWALLAHSFLKLSTATGASGHTVYRERTLKRQSADAALFKKELARFTASPNYNAQLRPRYPAAAGRGRGARDQGRGDPAAFADGLRYPRWLRGGAAVHGRVYHRGNERHGDALCFARGEKPLACTVAAGHALAGAARKAQGAACAHGDPGARAACMHGFRSAAHACAAAHFRHVAFVHCVLRLPRADTRRDAGEPHMDE